MKKWLHYLAHLTKWNYGFPVCKFDGKGNLWAGFQCCTCGKIQGRHIAKTAEELQKLESEQ